MAGLSTDQSVLGERLLACGRRKGAVEFGEVSSRQADVQRAPILPNMQGFCGARDGADVIVAQHPSECCLRRSGVTAGGDRREHGMGA